MVDGRRLVSNGRGPGARRVVPISAAAALVSGLVLAGCTGSPASAPSGTLSPSVSASPSATAASPLLPVYPKQWSTDAAALETARVGDLMVALIDPSIVANDDAAAEEVPASDAGGAYYGVLHTVSLTPSLDPSEVARQLVAELSSAGWAVVNSTDSDGITQVVLVSSPDPARSWLVAVGADSTVAGQSVVSIQLASPDLP